MFSFALSAVRIKEGYVLNAPPEATHRPGLLIGSQKVTEFSDRGVVDLQDEKMASDVTPIYMGEVPPHPPNPSLCVALKEFSEACLEETQQRTNI